MKRTSLPLMMATLVILSLPASSSAKDAAWASVTPLPTETPLVFTNGNPYSPGTFAVGTIQLFYTVNATTFPSGTFASFQLNLGVKTGPTTGQQSRYPVNLTLNQTGSQNLVLDPDTDSFNVTGSGWSDATTVRIIIPASVSSNPDLNLDGTDLVGNLQLVAPGGSHFDTPTTVQVHIKLVHPTACLRVYNFITDQGFEFVPLSSVTVHLGGPRTNRRVVGTAPGQVSDNVLVINNCAAAQSFNLSIVLDPHFATNGHGNAVFTYFTSGNVDPENFDLSVFGSGTPNGQNLWLEDITLAPGQSFLARVHMGIVTGNPPTWLGPTAGTPPAGIFGGFSATLFAPGTGPSTLAAAPLAGMAEPNPVSTSLGFTVQ